MNVQQPLQWVESLMEEIQSFDGSLFPPTEPMSTDDSEKIVGECPEDLRRFYSYMRYCQREMKQAQLEQEFAANDSERSGLQSRIFDMRSRASFCSLVLWSCINEMFGEWASVGHFAMRAEWKITFRDCDHAADGPADIFRRLFGGGQ